MDLRLKYAPIPDSAPLFAADIAQSAFEVHRIDLDYRVAGGPLVIELPHGGRVRFVGVGLTQGHRE